MNNSIVEWNNENEGGISGGSSWRKIYSLKYGIYKACEESILNILNNPDELVKSIPCPKNNLLSKLSPLKIIYPYLGEEKIHMLIKEIYKIGEYMKTQIDINTIDKNLDLGSNVDFLYSVGMKRNWKQCCSICLENIGDTYGTGYRKITMFHPCGHVICTQPCLRQIANSSNIYFQSNFYSVDDVGREFKEIDTNSFKYLKNFNCHNCRSLVTHCFSTLSLSIKGSYLENFCNSYSDNIYKHYNTVFSL